MKALLSSLFVLIMLSSCEIYVVDPIYDVRNDYVGYYLAEEVNRTTGEYSEYEIRVVKSFSYDDVVYIRNFYGLGLEVLAEVRGNRLIIPDQSIDGYFIHGEAWLSGPELNIDFHIQDEYRNYAPVYHVSILAY